MKIAVFATKSYDRRFFGRVNQKYHFELEFFVASLDSVTASLANGFDAVCVFVNDELGAECLAELAAGGTQIVALRCAGFNNVDLQAAASHSLSVVRVPAYSPYGVAEHAVALILGLNRKTHKAYNRVRERNFALEGLLGFNLHAKTVGVIGTGKIGEVFCRIMQGFGCAVLAVDPCPNEACLASGVEYVGFEPLLEKSDILSIHCPLTPETFHLIGSEAVERMKQGVMLINTSRGAIIDTVAVIKGLKKQKIGYLGLDVYEEEADLFFEDISDKILEDDVFARLLTFPNVLITGHQAFFTSEALENIASTTFANLACFEQGIHCPNLLAGPAPESRGG